MKLHWVREQLVKESISFPKQIVYL